LHISKSAYFQIFLIACPGVAAVSKLVEEVEAQKGEDLEIYQRMEDYTKI
jgi:hypothetical protein